MWLTGHVNSSAVRLEKFVRRAACFAISRFREFIKVFLRRIEILHAARNLEFLLGIVQRSWWFGCPLNALLRSGLSCLESPEIIVSYDGYGSAALSESIRADCICHSLFQVSLQLISDQVLEDLRLLDSLYLGNSGSEGTELDRTVHSVGSGSCLKGTDTFLHTQW